MKAGLFIAAASFLEIAAAQPQRHNHALAHQKRQVYVTDVTYATVTAGGPNVVVYVDAAGNPVSTSTVGDAAPTPDPVPAPVPAPVDETTAPAPVAPTTTEASIATTTPVESTFVAPSVAAATEAFIPPPAATTTAAPAVDTTKPAPVVPDSTSAAPVQHASSAPAKSGALANVGIVYSPYTAGGQCKTQDQVNTDFADLGPKGYGLVRIYGTDCNQVSTVGSAAKQYGMKVFLGIFNINDVQNEAQIIIDASNGDYSYIDTISIGNELVNSGGASASQVVAAVNQARGILNGAGYSGHIVTVDTVQAVMANLELCQVSDYAAVNAHPFFDPNLYPLGAGVWAIAQKALVGAACGKQVKITETGMPWGGSCNGAMCPSYADQSSVLSSLAKSLSGDYILLGAYNDLWKQNNAYTFNAEQNWGIYGDAPSA